MKCYQTLAIVRLQHCRTTQTMHQVTCNRPAVMWLLQNLCIIACLLKYHSYDTYNNSRRLW